MQEELKNKWNSMMKESLHQAVVKVLAEDGFAGLTMDRITQEAGIAKGTIYNYFKDKQELLQSVIQSSLEPLEAENERIFASELPPARKIEEYVLNTLGFFEKHRNFFRIMLDPELSGPKLNPKERSRHEEILAKLSTVFEEGQKTKVFRSLPPIKLAGMLFMSCVSITIGRFRMGDSSPIEDDVRTVIDVFFKGISSEV